MGVNHSMNDVQVNAVLSKFEATTDAIRGIESKVKRVNEHVIRAEAQRATIGTQAEAATKLMDGLTESLNSKSEVAVSYFLRTLDTFADLIEAFEVSISELGILNAPREVQRELGPLLMPAVVLVITVTISNCVFGFLLAADTELAATFVLGSEEMRQDGEAISILNLFAIFHVVLISITAVYLGFEGARRVCRGAGRGQGVVHEPEFDEYSESEPGGEDVPTPRTSPGASPARRRRGGSPRGMNNTAPSFVPVSSMLRSVRKRAQVTTNDGSGVLSWFNLGRKSGFLAGPSGDGSNQPAANSLGRVSSGSVGQTGTSVLRASSSGSADSARSPSFSRVIRKVSGRIDNGAGVGVDYDDLPPQHYRCRGDAQQR